MVFEAAHGQRPGEEGGYGGTWERVIEGKDGVQSEAREKMRVRQERKEKERGREGWKEAGV